MKKMMLISCALAIVVHINAQYVNELAVSDYQYPDDEKAAEVYQKALSIQADTTASATKVTWLANPYGSNWFLSVEGGLAWGGTEDYRSVAIKDNLFPTAGIAVGKWFSPVWGLRFGIAGAKLKGYTPSDGGVWYVGDNHPFPNGKNSQQSYLVANDAATKEFVKERFLDEVYKTGYRYDYTYASAGVDFLLNLKNLFVPYKSTAFFNPVLYGGLGFAHTFKDGDRAAVNCIMEKGGLQFNFSVAERLDLYASGEVLLLPEVFDRCVGGDKTMDLVVNFKIGLTYHFNYKNFIKAPLIDQKQLDALNAEISTLRKQIK